MRDSQLVEEKEEEENKNDETRDQHRNHDKVLQRN